MKLEIVYSNSFTKLYEFKLILTYSSGQSEGSSNDDANCPLVFQVFGYNLPTRSEGIAVQFLSSQRAGYYYTQALSNEIQTYHRPCLVGGYGSYSNNGIFSLPSGAGHEWVCDGSNKTFVYTGTTNTYKDFYGNITTQKTYTTTVVWYYLHLNWGYDVKDNGFYSGANYTKENSSAPGFQYFQTIITGISPATN